MSRERCRGTQEPIQVGRFGHVRPGIYSDSRNALADASDPQKVVSQRDDLRCYVCIGRG
jgi:hypothetical protein